MGKSARVLGQEFGRSAREMNQLLKEHGYLDGEPGAYQLTEKGKQYGENQYHSRGTGGYAHNNRNWETRTWNDETALALQADMKASPSRREVAAEGDEPAGFVYFDDKDVRDEEPDAGWTDVVVSGAIIGAILIAPLAKPFWNDTVKPAADKLRSRLHRGGSSASAPSLKPSDV